MRHPTNGLTLAELFVVLTAIAILAGVLLPALARSREEARCNSRNHGNGQNVL